MERRNSRLPGRERAANLWIWLLGAVTLVAAAPAPSQRPRLAEPEMAAIPAGSFDMGSAEGAAWERPVHDVRTQAFAIGVRPVSNAQYRAFRPSHESWGSAADNAPVTGVSWYDAQAYCVWLSGETGKGYQLPLEVWWERAARGGLEQQPYPWGAEPPASAAASGGALPPLNGLGVQAGFNLWEWVADWYGSDYYAQSLLVDPTGPIDGVFRTLRGGGYRGEPSSATTYSRGSARPTTRSELITFRVARRLADDAPELAPPPSTVTQAPAAPIVRAPLPPLSHGPVPAGVAAISTIAVEDNPGELVVRVKTGQPVRFQTEELTEPDRLVVDLLEAANRTGRQLGRIDVGQMGVERIRYSQFQQEPPIFRLVVDHNGPIDYQLEVWDETVLLRLRPKAPASP